MAPDQPKSQQQIAQEQIHQVRQLAGIIHEYREHPGSFTKFQLMCGITFGADPVSGLISVTPSKQDEQFRCKNKELLEQAGSERDAFFDAVDFFATHEVALAWNGKAPNKEFQVPREMSLNFAHPTMNVEIEFRRKGEPDAFRLSMLFIGFDNLGSATLYAGKRQGLLK